MSNDRDSSAATPGLKLPSWLVIVVALGLLGFGWWKNNPPAVAPETGVAAHGNTTRPIESDDRRPSEILSDTHESPRDETPHEHRENASSHGSTAIQHPTGPLPGPLAKHRERPTSDDSSKEVAPDAVNHERHSGHSDESSYKVDNQTIRNLEGKVVFKGTIDLKPTLDRITRGEANRHRNDGTSFQNREGRLPRKPSGYYKEYVHPTPGESGPGPQRIIFGEDGEIWYTPDHYKTFKQIKSSKD